MTLAASRINPWTGAGNPSAEHVVSYLRTSIDPKFVDDLLKAVGPR